MRFKHSIRCATIASLALAFSGAQAAADTTHPNTETASKPTQATKPLTGKQKATAIGATTGAVAGAVVGGPVGAVVGAGVGGYVGHEGTDANGKVGSGSNGNEIDGTVRTAQTALLDRGYSVGAVDGQWGPNTQSAVRRFQADHGIAQTGSLDDATLSALGVSR